MGHLRYIGLLFIFEIIPPLYFHSQVVMVSLPDIDKDAQSEEVFYPPLNKMPLIELQGSTGKRKLFKGKSADIADYPYMVHMTMMYETANGICGGTYIHRDYVLTALHCVRMNPLPFKIQCCMGSSIIIGFHCEDPTNTRKGKHIFYKTKMDIVLVSLNKPFQISAKVGILHVSRFDISVFYNKSCVGPGWGRYGPGTRTSNTLRKAYFEIMPTEESSRYIYADSPEGNNACLGDSGSPLVCENMLIGVASTSTTAECLRGDGLTFYVNLNFANRLISDVLEGEYTPQSVGEVHACSKLLIAETILLLLVLFQV